MENQTCCKSQIYTFKSYLDLIESCAGVYIYRLRKCAEAPEMTESGLLRNRRFVTVEIYVTYVKGEVESGRGLV